MLRSRSISPPRDYYVNGVTNKTSETNNVLKPLTAWIYSDFLDNKLPLFLTGFVPPTTDNDKARYHNTVQLAIWMSIIPLPQSTLDNYIDGSGYSQTWLNELVDPSNYAYSSTDFRSVQIMNLLTGPGGSKIQDQLVRNTPEPTAFIVWALLIGSMSLGARRPIQR